VYANIIATVNQIDPGTITGMIYKSYLRTYDEVLLAIETVFGPIESAPIDIGYLVPETHFKKTNTFFKKLKFMIIEVEGYFAIDPLQLADSVMRRCEAHQENAKSRGIHAEILCIVHHPSEGFSPSGTVASLENFYSFWCRIVEKLKTGTTHAKIIMKSSFDKGLNAFSHEISQANPYLIYYHLGWWKRNSDSKFDESAYTEKIESKDYLIFHAL